MINGGNSNRQVDESINVTVIDVTRQATQNCLPSIHLNRFS